MNIFLLSMLFALHLILFNRSSSSDLSLEAKDIPSAKNCATYAEVNGMYQINASFFV
jgi:hypothetical protein